jgi:hypothetical protein
VTLQYFAARGKQWVSLDRAFRTQELTVFRTLWLELDHMVAPGPNDGPFDGAGVGNDDVWLDPGEPPIDLMQTSLAEACIIVWPLSFTYDQKDGAQFKHNMIAGESSQVGGAVRDVASERHFWVVHTIGAYEEAPANDWDPNGEVDSWLGWAYQCGEDKSNFIFYETIRDRHANDLDPGRDPVDVDILTNRVVLHEALHRFLGMHGGSPDTGVADGVMVYDTAIYGTPQQNALTPRQIRVMQSRDYPK